MSNRSGCGLTELTILENLAALAAGRRPQHHVKTSLVLAGVEEQIGLGPRYAYQLLIDLTRPWMVAMPLVSGRGNFGFRDYDEPAAAHYTESRQSRVGQLVLDAEAGRVAPVPVGLINGSLYRGGPQPPLEPSAAIRALRLILADQRVSDADILASVGGPHSVTGCDIDGDLDELMRGRPARIRETSRIAVTGLPVPEPGPQQQPGPPGRTLTSWAGVGDGPPFLPHLTIEALPWQVNTTDAMQTIVSHSTARLRRRDYPDEVRRAGLPIADLRDEYEADWVRIHLRLSPGSDPAGVRDRLLEINSLSWSSTWQFPAPLTTLLRSWVRQHHSADLAASLTQLEQAIH